MRVLRVALAALVACGAAVVAVPPAAALDPGTLCASGSELVAGYGCINPTTGDLTKLVYDGKVPAKVNKLSSELDAVGGPGNTKAQKINGAVLAGSSRWSRLLGKAGTGLAAYSGFEFGYSLGQEAASFACGSLGWSIFCDPRDDVSPEFVPNVDVVIGDAGWLTPAILDFGAGKAVTMAAASSNGSAGSPGYLWMTRDQSFADNSSGTGWTRAGWTADGNSCSLGQGFSGSAFPGVGWPAGTMSFSCMVGGNPYVPAIVGMWKGTGVTQAQVLRPWPPAVMPDVTYAAVGSIQRPPDVDPDPLRRWETTVQCKQADGSTKDYTATSAEFRETDETWPALPSITCPAGEVQSSAAVRELGGPSPIEVWSVDIPQNIQDAHVEFPQCVAGGCLLTLWSVSELGQRTDCFLSSAACEGWLADPQRDSHFQCTYGLPDAPIDVPLSECYIYGPAFEPQSRGAGVPYGDPADGSALDAPVVVPESGTDPGAVPDASEGGCWPSGWGVFNPLEWVYRPIVCAFKPRPQVVQEQLQTTWETVKTRPPVSVVYPAAGFVTGFITNAGSTCSGSIADFGDGLVIPCQPPAGIAVFINILRWIITVLFAGYTAFVIWGMVEKSFSR